MNEQERAEFLETIDRQSADIVPVMLEAFRVQADEYNLDPIAGLYVSAKVFIFLASFCAHLMATNGVANEDIDELVMGTIEATKSEIQTVMEMSRRDEDTTG